MNPQSKDFKNPMYPLPLDPNHKLPPGTENGNGTSGSLVASAVSSLQSMRCIVAALLFFIATLCTGNVPQLLLTEGSQVCPSSTLAI